MTDLSSRKIALVYDRVNKWGGAERVLLALHELFPDAPLYTSVYNPDNAPWAASFQVVFTSFLQNLPFARDNHEHFAYLMPLAFESFNFDRYDLVISVTSEAAKGIITKPKIKHICYLLTPTRYLWSHYDFYFKNKILRYLSEPAIRYLRNWDKIAAQRPDQIISISKTVQSRVKKYYNRESKVIYPPITLKGIRDKALSNSFYLVVSRLVPYKRVDLAIEAFNELRLPLVVVGTGSEEQKLKKMAKENINFTGQLTDDKLSEYYEKCAALVTPQEEDFGLVAVEAQSFGKPVIAYRKGGAIETVIDGLPAQAGKTGIFFEKQTVESLIKAVKQFNSLPAGKAGLTVEPLDCIKNAKRFSKERFKKEFLNLIENL